LPPAGASGSGKIAILWWMTVRAEVEALIVPPAIGPGKPSRPAPACQARQHRRTTAHAEGHRPRDMRCRAWHSVAGPLPLAGRADGRREDQGRWEGSAGHLGKSVLRRASQIACALLRGRHPDL